MKFEIVKNIPRFPPATAKGRPPVEWEEVHHAIDALNHGETLVVWGQYKAPGLRTAATTVTRKTGNRYYVNQITIDGRIAAACQLQRDDT